MEFLKFLHFVTFLSLAIVGSRADLGGYWKSKLPNTRMPKSVRDLLHNDWLEGKSTSVTKGFTWKYSTAATENQLSDDPNAALFFLEKDFHSGTTMNLHFTKSPHTPGFLPRKVADSIPFSSESVPEILNRFDLKPDSAEAKVLKKTINECEEPEIKGEEKYCATSLESMIDFATSKLGESVKVVSTEVQKETKSSQKYKIVDAKKLNSNDKAVVCHKQNYAYAVFYCHSTQTTEAYEVYLVGADGTKVKAVAVCHKDTAAWNPKNLAFQVLKVKPGSVPVCHFLRENLVVWVYN